MPLMGAGIPQRSYLLYRCEGRNWFTRSGTTFVNDMITLTPEVSSLPPVSPGPRAGWMGPRRTGDSNGRSLGREVIYWVSQRIKPNTKKTLAHSGFCFREIFTVPWSFFSGGGGGGLGARISHVIIIFN